MLDVIAIIGVLVGLMLPAIQQVRGVAEATQRLNWKRQRRIDDPPPRRVPYRILFVGNSHTSNGGIDIPDAVARLESRHPPLQSSGTAE